MTIVTNIKIGGHTVYFLPYCIIKLGLVEKWKEALFYSKIFGVGMAEKIANFPVCDTNGKRWTEKEKV